MKNKRKQTSPNTGWDFSTCFACLSPLIGVLVGLLGLVVFAR